MKDIKKSHDKWDEKYTILEHLILYKQSYYKVLEFLFYFNEI